MDRYIGLEEPNGGIKVHILKELQEYPSSKMNKYSRVALNCQGCEAEPLVSRAQG